jgi:hypothetical protein
MNHLLRVLEEEGSSCTVRQTSMVDAAGSRVIDQAQLD